MNKYEELYLSQYINCKQYYKCINISNEDLYELITVSNKILLNTPNNSIHQLLSYLLLLAYKDALIDVLDERYDNTN
ncbi:hypothetical protein [uncultured phage cr52_1]|uniref:Uncharacterized protein n=1 Tax=uncultured phage cr52_1 TaxID=2772079 RepID=A0A7M1RUI7_9CAUD|nr:hypothetical protein KNV46_gp84 [uncultured phage cr52_1]QOR56690.1 hypothetical protein [uncultured phage cr52_1]